jgi:hypothetical protein
VKLSPAFIRNSTTVFAYTWVTKGKITAISVVVDRPNIPVGCTVSG